jgi:hypothetical protein
LSVQQPAAYHEGVADAELLVVDVEELATTAAAKLFDAGSELEVVGALDETCELEDVDEVPEIPELEVDNPDEGWEVVEVDEVAVLDEAVLEEEGDVDVELLVLVLVVLVDNKGLGTVLLYP